MSFQPLDPLDMEIYHLNPKGEQKQIKLGEVNKPPTASMAEKHPRMGLQQYATILQENNIVLERNSRRQIKRLKIHLYSNKSYPY